MAGLVNCPYCNAASSVLETRASVAGTVRRRLCAKCKGRFTTLEVVKPDTPIYEPVALVPRAALAELRDEIDAWLGKSPPGKRLDVGDDGRACGDGVAEGGAIVEK